MANSITKSGYIVLNDYDKDRIDDKEFGVKVRSYIMECISNVLNSIVLPEKANLSYAGNNIVMEFSGNETSYRVIICTINHIVNRNKTLMSQGLQAYPFNKGMDKYGAIYIAISSGINSARSQKTMDAFIARIIDELNNVVSGFDNLGEKDRFKYVPALMEEVGRC